MQHKTGRRYQKPEAATYQPNQRPFDGKSMTRSDYHAHSNVDKSEMVKHDNSLFVSDDPLDQETTNNQTYKSWEVQRRQVGLYISTILENNNQFIERIYFKML